MSPTQPDHPGLITRLVARLSHEVSAETLDAYRRAGLGVYDLLSAAESRRGELAGGGAPEVDDATRCFLLCAWNAFGLQALGDSFVQADYDANPRTVGFVPRVTREQAMRFYGEVEGWIARGHEAQSNPQCGLPIALPAELPAFVTVDPCPREHLVAMLDAARMLGEHADTAIVDAERLPGASSAQLDALRGLLASAGSAADYARHLYGDGNVPQSLHERIESSTQKAIAEYYLAGQLAVIPGLAGHRPTVAHLTGRAGRVPGPGEPGFDPWCLTDPHTRTQWQRDHRAREAIDLLWAYDPRPRATLELKAEVDAALQEGHVTYATDRHGHRLGNYYCCPWSAVYQTTCPVMLAGRRLRAGQQFVIDVSAEELAEGGEFKRQLQFGSFSPTDSVDYCDPRTGGD